MTDLKPKNSGTRSLFQSTILEKATRTHIAVPLIIFAVYAVSLLIWSGFKTHLTALETIAFFLIGLFFWSFAEYSLHRFVFHHAQGTKLQYTIHGIHHEFPKDKDRLAMPPVISITIATSLLFIFRWLMGDAGFSFLSGFICGYATYLCVHYMIHAFPSPQNFLKILWVNHSIHHYKNGEQLFGVSSPFWDYVFGTMPKK